MPKRKRTLPDYDNPPVTEVVISVQFDKLNKFGIVHPGLYWNRIRKNYPKFEEHPPLQSIFEKFDDKEPQVQEVEFSTVPPLPRIWFLDESGNRLVQLQSTRFIHNWRKITGEEDYPRYERIRKEFSELWKDFLNFVSEQKLGEVKPNHWELTYVNHIQKGDGWNSPKDLGKLFPCMSDHNKESFLPEPEHINFKSVYIFPKVLGRLYISFASALRRSDLADIIRLDLTARGRLDSPDTSSIMCGLDNGHEWIVRGFTDFTSSEAHKIWKRKDI